METVTRFDHLDECCEKCTIDGGMSVEVPRHHAKDRIEWSTKMIRERMYVFTRLE